MPGLRYNNTDLLLPPDWQLDWELEDDPLDTDAGGGEGHSWPVDIPREGNHDLLWFAGDPNSPINHRSYDGFEITFDSRMWWSVTFRHKKTTHRWIRGTFSVVSSVFYSAKDQSIRGYLPERFTNIAVGSRSSDYSYLDPVFPYVAFYNSRAVFYLSSPQSILGFSRANASSTYKLLPCFYLMDVLRSVLKNIGLDLEDNFSSTGDTYQKLILVHNRISEMAYDTGYEKVSDYVTDMTVSELLGIVNFYAGTSHAILIKENIVEINSLDRARTLTPIDISGAVEVEDTESDEMPRQNVKVTYTLDDDQLLKNTVTPEGTYLRDYTSVSSMIASNPSPSDGEYGFCKRENAYYKYSTQVEGDIALQLYTYPFYDYSTGETDPLEASSIAIPARKDQYTHKVLEESGLDLATIYSYIFIKGFDSVPSISVGDYIMMEEQADSTDDQVYSKIWREVTAIGTLNGDNYVQCANDIYVSNSKLRKVFVRESHNEYFPEIGHEIYLPEKDLGKEMKKPRVMIYHGLQDITSGAGTTYAYASCDRTSSNGTDLGTHTLNTHESETFVDYTWKKWYEFMQNSIQLILYTSMTAETLKQAFSRRVIRWEKGLMLVTKVRTLLGSTGAKDQEVQGYRL